MDDTSRDVDCTGLGARKLLYNSVSLLWLVHIQNEEHVTITNGLATDHCAQNLQAYVEGTIPASERRVLLSQWVGQLWEELSAKKVMVKRSFKKCRISVPIDGSKDDEIKIQVLGDYTVKEADGTEVDGASEDEDDMEAEFSDDDPFE